MHRCLVKIIYKHTLKVCNDMGFKYGSRNNMMICQDTSRISESGLERKIRQNKIGEFMGNNVVYHYKKHKDNYMCMEDLIDYGFSAFKWTCYLKELYIQYN